MKLKLNLNKIILFVSVFAVVVWMFMRSSRRTELLTTEQDTLVKYIDGKEDIASVAFIVAEMSKAISTENNMFNKVLELATENKKDEIKKLISEK